MRVLPSLILVISMIVGVIEMTVMDDNSWFKPSPNLRSPQYQYRSRYSGSRLLNGPRRMYRRSATPQTDDLDFSQLIADLD